MSVADVGGVAVANEMPRLASVAVGLTAGAEVSRTAGEPGVPVVVGIAVSLGMAVAPGPVVL